MFTEAEGTAFELSWELHMIAIPTRLAKAKLGEGVFPSPFLKHQFVHILLFLPRKEKAIVKHYKVDYCSPKMKVQLWQFKLTAELLSVKLLLSRLCWKDLSAHQGLKQGVPCTHEAPQTPLCICNSSCDTAQLPTAAEHFWLLFKINIKN